MNNVDFGIENNDIGLKNDCFLEDKLNISIRYRGPTPFDFEDMILGNESYIYAGS